MVFCIHIGQRVEAWSANFCSFQGVGGGFKWNYFCSFRWASANFCDDPYLDQAHENCLCTVGQDVGSDCPTKLQISSDDLEQNGINLPWDQNNGLRKKKQIRMGPGGKYVKVHTRLPRSPGHSVERAGWQAKMASVEFWIPMCTSLINEKNWVLEIVKTISLRDRCDVAELRGNHS